MISPDGAPFSVDLAHAALWAGALGWLTFFDTHVGDDNKSESNSNGSDCANSCEGEGP